MEQILLEAISTYIKKKVTGSHQHRYMKAESFLMNLIDFCDEITGSLGEEKRERLLISTSARFFTLSPKHPQRQNDEI